MHEMKATTFESIRRMNEGFEQTIRSLKELGQLKLISKDSLRSIVVEIEEVRAGANADFGDQISERERAEHARFGRERRAYEKRLEDPDDVYVIVQQREERRKNMGLAPRAFIFPWNLEDDERALGAGRRRAATRTESRGAGRNLAQPHRLRLRTRPKSAKSRWPKFKFWAGQRSTRIVFGVLRFIRPKTPAIRILVFLDPHRWRRIPAFSSR